jgi:hypothetical protein
MNCTKRQHGICGILCGLVLTLGASTCLTETALAEDYLPLSEGFWWSYVGDDAIERKEVPGTVEIWGEEVRILRYMVWLDRYELSGGWTPGDGLREASDWYSDGVGAIQYITNALYRLTAFEQPTPVVETPWGAIRRLYSP